MVDTLKNNEIAEFINEIRHIAERYKNGQIKDWGRLRTIIGNLVSGNLSDYYFDMNKDNPYKVKIESLTAQLDEARTILKECLDSVRDDYHMAVILDNHKETLFYANLAKSIKSVLIKEDI